MSVAGQDREQLVDGRLDMPQPGCRLEAHSLAVAGWVLGRDVPVVGVEILHEGTVIGRARLGHDRPDLVAAFPEHSDGGMAGFRVTVPVLGTTPAVDLQVTAVLADHGRAHVAVISARPGWGDPPPADPDAALVSVVIPCYDQAHFLPDALNSVLAQTHQQIEVVVVDDGSADNTSAIAAGYPGVHCIRQPNRGLAAARNTGLRHTTGDYLVFLDADDRLLPHALSIGLRELTNHPDAAFVFGHYRLVGYDGEFLFDSEQLCSPADPVAALLSRNYIAMLGTVVFKGDPVRLVGGFDPSLDSVEDLDLYLRLATNFSFFCHHETVADYRQHGTTLSRRRGRMLAGYLAVLRLQDSVIHRRPELRAARREGRRFVYSHYGAPLVAAVLEEVHDRNWWAAVRDAAALRAVLPRPRFERHIGPEGSW